MTRRVIPLLFSLAANLVACGGNQEDQIAELTIPVSVEPAQRSSIVATLATTGTVQAEQEETITTTVEGILHLSRSLASGQVLRAGQLLAEIENPEYLLEVRVESQKLAMENAQRELEKQQALFTEGGVTEKELELARRNALDARLNYEAATLRVGKMKMTAPVSGVLTGLQTASNGVRVRVGFQLCSIKAYTSVRIPVELPNTDLGHVRQDQEVLIRNYTLPDRVFDGQVRAIDPAINPQTRSFTVTIGAANPELLLRPGMFVKIDIIKERREQAIVIAKTALQTRNNAPVVFVVEGASAEMRQVVTGIETRETVEIVSGLNEGERLVVKGQETLRDKAKVRVLE